MNMVKRMVDSLQLDPERIYITGLSAGAGMTVTILGGYPDCFAGGAPMAGVPFDCAGKGLYRRNRAVGLECMCIDVNGLWEKILAALWLPGKVALADYEQNHAQCARMEEPLPGRTAEYWGSRLTPMADNPGGVKWPRISIWQGAEDVMVAPVNVKRLMQQWTNVHGLDPAKGTAVQEPPASPYDVQHTTYANTSGRVQVETYLIKRALPLPQAPATGHATAVDPDKGCGCDSVDCACEKQAVCNEGNKTGYIKDANICSSLRVAQFWGLDQPTTTPSGAPSSARRCKALR